MKNMIHLASLAVLANDLSAFFPKAPSDLISQIPTGQVFALGNDANFDSALLAQPLTDFATGLPMVQEVQRVLNSIVPDVRVSKRFSYAIHNEKMAFTDHGTAGTDMRALGGEFPIVSGKGTQTEGRTYSKGLMQVLDTDEGGEDPQIQQQAAAELTHALYLAEIIRAIALLEANAVDTAKTWDSGTTATPDNDVAVAANLGGDARGVDSNRVIFGGGAWLSRHGACQRNANPGVSTGANFTPQQLASILGLDEVVVSNVRYQSAAATKAKVVGAKVYAYHASKMASRFDPSNIKRFVSEGLQTYVITELKRTKIVVCHHTNLTLTNSLGIRKLTIS